MAMNTVYHLADPTRMLIVGDQWDHRSPETAIACHCYRAVWLELQLDNQQVNKERDTPGVHKELIPVPKMISSTWLPDQTQLTSSARTYPVTAEVSNDCCKNSPYFDIYIYIIHI